MMTDRPVLSLCIPTFNRIKVLLPDVRRYLSLPDRRFELCITDNLSKDGTVEALSALKDERLSLYVNVSNIGPVRNGMAALSKAQGEYIFFLIDKDTVDEQRLSHFIDYLVREKPCFGFIELNSRPEEDFVEVIQPGLGAVLRAGFLGKHPSGYFWRSDLFRQAAGMPIVDSAAKETDFPFDMVAGFLAVEHPASIVHLPLVINANLRPVPQEYSQSFTYHGESKFFCSAENRLKTFRYYLTATMQLNLSRKDMEKIDLKLTNRVINQVTVSLRKLLLSPSVCEHYMLKSRKVSIGEMFSNLANVWKVRKEVTRSYHAVGIIRSDIFFAFAKGIIRIFEQILIEPFDSSKLELGV